MQALRPCFAVLALQVLCAAPIQYCFLNTCPGNMLLEPFIYLCMDP